MGLVPCGAVMEGHADVDDAPTTTCLQGLERCLAHGECAQRVNVKHCACTKHQTTVSSSYLHGTLYLGSDADDGDQDCCFAQ